MGNTGPYEKALEAAEQEMTRLLEDREVLDRRIAQLRQTIASLSQLCGLASKYGDTVGLTEACIEVLRASDGPLTPGEVKKGLEQMGYEVSGYSNAMASIHTTLKRLVLNRTATKRVVSGHPAYELATRTKARK